MRKRLAPLWAAGAALACLPVAPAAWAADDGAQRSPVDQIVVTARRTDAPQTELPTQFGLVAQDEIDLIKAEHPSEALFRVPGVFIHRGSGQEHLTAIRSPVLTGGAGAGSFLFLQDGIPLRAAGFANVNGLFEAHTEFASALEVTKGPGSALFGSNAVHGLINVLTRAPTEETELFAEALGGSFGRYRGRVSASGTAGNHGFWGGVSLLNENGFRADSGLDQQKVTLRHDYQGDGLTIESAFHYTNLNQETAGFVLGPNAFADPDLFRTNPNPEAFRDVQSLRANSRITLDLSDTRQLVVTPFLRYTDMDFLQHFLPGTPLEQNRHWSVGVQSALYQNFGQSLLIFGLDTEYTDGALSEVQEAPTVFSFTQGVHYDYQIEATVAAPFVHGEWQANDWLRVIGGLRTEYTYFDYENRTEDGIVGRFLRPGDRTDAFFTVTPKLGAVADLTPQHQLFANYARGARAPQTTDLYRLQQFQTVGEIDPEVADSVELGTRGVFGPLTYSVAGFFIDKRNFFFRDADGLNVPDGRTRHAGVEIDGLLEVTRRLSLSGNATYARHTYRFDRPVTNNATESISFGDFVDTAPRMLAGARAAYAFLPGSVAELEWVHVGSYFTDAANDNRYDGHDLLNLRLIWQANDTLNLFVNIRNLTDIRYAERADFAFGNERFFPGESLNVSGGASLRFN